MEEYLVPAHRNQHFQRLGATTEMPKMRKVELRAGVHLTAPAVENNIIVIIVIKAMLCQLLLGLYKHDPVQKHNLSTSSHL
jgi:hypothetical protein